MPDKGNTPPRQESMAPACKFTLNWDQDILEPLKSKWRPAAKDTPATPQHKVESVVKPADSQLWLRLLPVAKAEAGSSERSSKKLPWALLQVPGTPGRTTSQRRQHLRSPVFQPEKRWKPVEGVRPRKTGLLTIKKRVLVSHTSPLGNKSVGLHRKLRHSGSLNRKARRWTSRVECWQWQTGWWNITSYQTTHFWLFLRSYRYRIAVPGMVGAVPTGPYSGRVQFYRCSYLVPGPVDVSVCDDTILRG